MMNEKAVLSEIRKSYCRGKGVLMWQRLNGYDFISNTHWAVKTNQISFKILGLLVSIFGTIPEEGKSLRFAWNEVKTDGPDINKVFEENRGGSEVKDTELTVASKDRYRLLLGNKYVIYMNEKYFELIGDGETEMTSEGELKPVICKTDISEILLLPVRCIREKTLNNIKEISERIGA